MANFPSLPSAENPSIGAAAGYASAAASIHNALMSAANQQADRQQRAKAQATADYQTQLQRDFENHRQMVNEGYIPKQVYANGDPLPGRPTLQTPEDNPAAQGKGQTVTAPDGTQMYKPTPGERDAAALNDTNSFTLSDDLAAEAQKSGLTNIRPGVRYPKADMQSLNERLAAYHKQHDPEPETFTYNGNDYKDENGKRILMMQGNRGTVKPADLSALHGQPQGGGLPGGPFDLSANPGTTASPAGAKAPGGITFAPADKLAKEPRNLHWEKHQTDNGTVTLRALDPESGEEVRKFVYPGEGTRRKGSDGAPTQKPPTRAQLMGVEVNKQKALQKAKLDFNKAVSEAITPEDKSAAVANYRGALQSSQLGYEQELSILTGQDVGHNSWADQPGTKQGNQQPATAAPGVQRPTPAGQPVAQPASPAAPGRGGSASAVPAQPPPAQAQSPGQTPKVTSLQKVREFARQKGISDAQAIREAQQSGWKIGQ